MRLVPIAAGLAGLALIAALILHFGAAAVARSLRAIGWTGFAAVCLIHLGLIAVMGIAWRALLPGTRPWIPIWGRLVRDSAAEVLPLSQVGGYVAGARAAVFAGLGGTTAAASTIVDVTLEFVAQLAYTAIALLLLLHFRPDAKLALPAGIGLAAASVLAALFLIAQRHGFNLLHRFARVLGRGWADRTASGAAALHAALLGIHARKTGLFASFSLHLACWIASAIEVWLALRFAGSPLGFPTVLVIEGLLYALRTAAFAVPNAVGVQEAGYVLLGATFGLTPEMALALSLLKRARDFAIGLPALAAWQLAESHRLWRRAARRRGA
ncbi:MAG TPA: lysylphosphatidylglycerol synthase domain-containing protein [Stellaceae bacterium]|nr:lysylphosphatidylglycerol synthase domain-containing protein [Stellaceae bacterium]